MRTKITQSALKMAMLEEPKRRNVFRVTAGYVVASWIILQVLDVLAPIQLIPDWIRKAILYLLILGFTAAVVLRTPDINQAVTPGLGYRPTEPASAIPRANKNLSDIFLTTGQWDSCIESGRRVLQLAPQIENVHGIIGWCLLFDGRHDEAPAETLLERNEQIAAPVLAAVYHSLNRPAESTAAFARATEVGSRPALIARSLVYCGQTDEAFDWLNRMSESEAAELGDPAIDPAWSGLLDDPRWQPWLESKGLSKKQLSAYEFDARLP